jgi:hypothetical protein
MQNLSSVNAGVKMTPAFLYSTTYCIWLIQLENQYYCKQQSINSSQAESDFQFVTLKARHSLGLYMPEQAYVDHPGSIVNHKGFLSIVQPLHH